MGPKLSVLLTTEGTYPVTRGGVSTWCDLLVNRTPGVEFTLLTLMANPYLTSHYALPASVRRWIQVPLWGCENPAWLEPDTTSLLYARRRAPTLPVIQDVLLPVLGRLLDRMWLPPAITHRDLVTDLVDLHRLFLRYDYQLLMKNPQVWDWYVSTSQTRPLPNLAQAPSVQDLAQSLAWLYRFLAVLATPIPPVHLAHASAAAFCALPCVVARVLHGIPFVLTEHGVFLREQYYSVGRSTMSPYLKTWLTGLVRLASLSAYATADVVAPVAAFNARWERQLGVKPDRIAVIYNGVDPTVYRPLARPAGAPPTVVSVARIDPVKDLSTLLRAAAIVVAARPEVRFVVYGGISVPAYYNHLLALRSELGLTEQFTFAGHTADVPAAYASGDVIALSSITEGFPYAVIEALMCRRPVVATDVGGTGEALGPGGLLVPPRDPRLLAAAIAKLLADGPAAEAMARAGHERALRLFTIDHFIAQYDTLYAQLVRTAGARWREQPDD